MVLKCLSRVPFSCKGHTSSYILEKSENALSRWLKLTANEGQMNTPFPKIWYPRKDTSLCRILAGNSYNKSKSRGTIRQTTYQEHSIQIKCVWGGWDTLQKYSCARYKQSKETWQLTEIHGPRVHPILGEKRKDIMGSIERVGLWMINKITPSIVKFTEVG